MRDLTYRIVNRLFLGLFAPLGLRFDVRGAERIPTRGAAVVAANHIGYLDFAFIGLAASYQGRLVRFMSKSGVFDNPLSGPLMRAMRHIPVVREQGAGAYRQAGRELKRGELVGVFPEATISRSWMLKDLKAGAAGLAVEHRVPIIPVIVWGGHRILTVDMRWSLRRRKAVTVLVGDRFTPSVGATARDTSVELRRRMADLLDQAQREYQDQPRTDEDRWWLPAVLGGTAPGVVEAARLDAEALARGAQRARRAG